MSEEARSGHFARRRPIAGHQEAQAPPDGDDGAENDNDVEITTVKDWRRASQAPSPTFRWTFVRKRRTFYPRRTRRAASTSCSSLKA